MTVSFRCTSWLSIETKVGYFSLLPISLAFFAFCFSIGAFFSPENFSTCILCFDYSAVIVRTSFFFNASLVSWQINIKTRQNSKPFVKLVSKSLANNTYSVYGNVLHLQISKTLLFLSFNDINYLKMTHYLTMRCLICTTVVTMFARRIQAQCNAIRSPRLWF